jgi:hypothetical protein
MSLVTKLRPHVEELKVHKKFGEMSATDRRLNFMTAIILNKTLSKEEKDKRLRKIVAEAGVEKALKARGVRI